MRLAVAPRSWRAAGPAAPPNRRASSRRTRCGRAARRRAALGDCWRQATHAAILVAAHCQCANQSASISSNARCSFFILWPQPSADARTAYKPTDNAKTGLNRDCFGTLAPGARLDHRAPAAAGRDAAEGRRRAARWTTAPPAFPPSVPLQPVHSDSCLRLSATMSVCASGFDERSREDPRIR